MESLGKIGALFLDVDGVLVTSRGVCCNYETTDDTLICDPNYRLPPIERRCLAQLSRILKHAQEKMNIKLVISSTWRADPSMFAFLKFALDQY